MPLICKDMVDLLDNTNTSAANHSSLSNYAFIYGVFPSAPSVAIYAAHYNMELEVVRGLRVFIPPLWRSNEIAALCLKPLWLRF
jgi:hypothetical protein